MILWVLMFQMAYAGPYIAYPTQELCEKAYNSPKITAKAKCVAFAADVELTRPERERR
jgi:hypothetical protein